MQQQFKSARIIPLSQWHFALVRCLFGTVLGVLFLAKGWVSIRLLVSNGGHMGMADHPLGGFFKGADAVFPWVVPVIMLVLAIVSLLMAVGIRRQVLSGVLLVGVMLMQWGHGEGMLWLGVLWVLVAFMVIPRGEGGCIGDWAGHPHWQCPKGVIIATWAVFFGLFLTGVMRLFEGEPFHAFDQIQYAWVVVVMLFIWFRQTRVVAWLVMVLVHGMISPSVMAWALMVVMHLILVEFKWFQPRKRGIARLVLFDGVCGLCNGWIDLLLDIDTAKRLQFSPLQGEAAKSYALPNHIPLSSIIYVRGIYVFTKSRAVLEICRDLGGVWAIGSLLRIVPWFIRDAVYDWVAKHRYRWFGKWASCRRPSTEEQRRFLP